MEFGLDLRGDVAVDLGEPVGQVVAEASGLGDLEDLVGDQPCLVTVSQTVEGEAGAYWGGGFAGVAVDGRSEHASVEGAAS